jgi:hypothetical protein
MLKRQPGETEYQNLGNWLGKMMSLVMKAWAKMFQMIKYGIEVQASQILQTGTLSLTDDKGNTSYTLDYKPKATHFPTTAVSWSTIATATPLDDIDALADVIRDDGLVDVTNVIMGTTAYKNFIRNADVQNLKTCLIIEELMSVLFNHNLWVRAQNYRVQSIMQTMNIIFGHITHDL